MRRSDKEIADVAEMEAIIGKSLVCRLALCSSNRPYLVPLCFGYENRVVYAHCAPEGLKIDILNANDAVCAEFEADVELVMGTQGCTWGMKYRSVMAIGRALILQESESKRHACDVIMRHYGGPEGPYDDDALHKIVALKIEIDQMTGKQSGY